MYTELVPNVTGVKYCDKGWVTGVTSLCNRGGGGSQI